VIARLREGLRPGERALGIGEELPPNVLMRYGLSDPRNYDSVELARNLEWFEPLYEPTDEARSSRRTVTWETVGRTLPLLADGAVAAVAASTPPLDPGPFTRVERAGDAWIARIDARPWASAGVDGPPMSATREGGGSIRIELPDGVGPIVVRETWDPGWSATADGSPVKIER
jgi:hypothetical protein